MYDQSFRACFERGCLAGWMLLLVTNTIILGLAIELFVVGILFSFTGILLITAQTAPLLVCGVFALLNFSVVVRLRKYGVDNLRFELHEHALNSFMSPPESWSDSILALLDETAARSNQLDLLVRLIDEAPGAVERQDRRAEAKTWLKDNWAKLNPEEREFVNERLGYLKV